MKPIADIRKDYKLKTLSEKDILPDPVEQFERWWREAIESELDEVNAMTLATAGSDRMPHARIVLLKDFSASGFTFYTNYESNKGNELKDNPQAALVFFWKELERQVRIEGSVARVETEASDAYFGLRPRDSQIGAWASPQSTVIESREWLEEHEAEYRANFEGQTIERPPHWGGYLVKPVMIEFWQGRPSRLHDRLIYTVQDDNTWRLERLAP